MQVCLYSLCFSHFLFIRDSGRRDIYPFRKTNNSIPWDEVFETLKRGCVCEGKLFLFDN